MKKITKRDYQRSEVKGGDSIPEALVLDDRSGICAVVFPVSEPIYDEFKDSFKRLELAIQFSVLAQKASESAPPLTPEEIEAEIASYRKDKKRD